MISFKRLVILVNLFVIITSNLFVMFNIILGIKRCHTHITDFVMFYDLSNIHYSFFFTLELNFSYQHWKLVKKNTRLLINTFFSKEGFQLWVWLVTLILVILCKISVTKYRIWTSHRDVTVEMERVSTIFLVFVLNKNKKM